MQTSILVIAHNEEKYIKKCIDSLINQTQKPDEIVVVVHNSTDRTLEILEEYKDVKVIAFNGEVGPVYARMEGIKKVEGDRVLCIDGDSVADNNWVEVMNQTLQRDNNILIGSYIKIKGTIFENVSNIFNRYFCVSKGKRATRWIWGASFAFWKKDKDFVISILEKSIDVGRQLNLLESRIAEDFWIALFMNKKGNIEVINKTKVTTYSKYTSITKAILRNKQNHKNGGLIENFLKST